MLKPVQVSLRAQLSEHSSSEDDDDVSFAVSKAHLTGPFCVVLEFLYDTLRVDTSVAVAGIIASSSSNGSKIGTNIIFLYVFSVCL